MLPPLFVIVSDDNDVTACEVDVEMIAPLHRPVWIRGGDKPLRPCSVHILLAFKHDDRLIWARRFLASQIMQPKRQVRFITLALRVISQALEPIELIEPFLFLDLQIIAGAKTTCEKYLLTVSP